MLNSPQSKGRLRSLPLRAGMPGQKSPRVGRASNSHYLTKMSKATMEGRERLPPSPSDLHASMDLRRAALLRSVLHRREVCFFGTKHPSLLLLCNKASINSASLQQSIHRFFFYSSTHQVADFETTAMSFMALQLPHVCIVWL